MSRLQIGLLAALVVVAPNAISGEAEQISQAVEATVDWESFWFGGYFGQQCIETALKRRQKGIAHTDVQKVAVGYQCESGVPIEQEIVMFDAYVVGAPVFVAGRLSPAPRADISDGEANSSCSLTEADLIAREKHIRRLGMSFPIRPTSPAERKSPSPELGAYALRSVRAYLRKTGRTDVKSITVGPQREQDPYLVVAAADDVYLIAAPSQDEVVSANFCGPVFSPDRFLGRTATQRSPSLLRRARENLAQRGASFEAQ